MHNRFQKQSTPDPSFSAVHLCAKRSAVERKKKKDEEIGIK